ncbi:unnamed protein product [Hymenolepis diminuta]|uniref:Transposase n=1 Tax=Hymenolepis diminuta TaxID=6216 RepID=A0A0R3SDB3_HYMDI|nr:unnamed protein product [Hymenolepis diminuta]
MNDEGLAGDAVGFDILKTKRQLAMMIRPVLRLEKVYDKKVKTVQNAAQRIMLGLHSRRQMSAQVLAEEVHLRNFSAQLQKRGLNFWASRHKNSGTKLGRSKGCYGKSNKSNVKREWLRNHATTCHPD